VLKLLMLLLTAAPATSSADIKRTVLFVCEHGSAKSVVAAAHFNRIAAGHGRRVGGVSRGTDPDAELAPAAVAGLRGDGLNPAERGPHKLEQRNLDGALRVVTFVELPAGISVTAPVVARRASASSPDPFISIDSLPRARGSEALD